MTEGNVFSLFTSAGGTTIQLTGGRGNYPILPDEGGNPILPDREYPIIPDGGTLIQLTGEGGTPILLMGYPHVAAGMPLAFTQEDFLVFMFVVCGESK